MKGEYVVNGKVRD